MNVDLLYTLTLLTALGCGLVAGVFFAFSTFVMKALSRLPPNEGIATMQSINVVVLKSLFLAVFFGTTLACALIIISALVYWHHPGAVWLLAGGGLYLVGTFLVTGVRNVPMNDALARVAPSDPESAKLWTNYLDEWIVWNHIRTVAALAAAASLIIVLSMGY